MSAKIVVVYHSGYGHTQRMAQAVADGAGARAIAIDADGQLQARVLAGQESFRIRPLPEANCWIVIDEAQDAPAAGTRVQVCGLGHLLAPAIETMVTR